MAGERDTTIVLVDGARTPIGRYGRALADVDPIDLGAHAEAITKTYLGSVVFELVHSQLP